jgi:transcriptional antiterminator RfaH
MSEASAPRWFVVRTHPHAENLAASHLRRQGFETYLPRYRKRRRHARRAETVAAPMFPGYLFVTFDSKEGQWRPIRSTIGVAGLICIGDRPTPLPAAVIDGLRAREGEAGLIELAAKPDFVTGDKIKIEDGAFADCHGLFQDMTDGERVTVLLDILGRKVRVALDADLVAAA